VVDLVVEIVHADVSAFFISNEAVETPFLVAAAQAGGGNGEPAADDLPGKELLLRLVRGKTPMLVPDNRGVADLSEKVRSFLGAPLVIRGEVFGVIVGVVTNGRRVFKEKELFYLSHLASNAAHAIESLALYENIYENLFATLYAFVTALGARDRYTQQHSNRVTGMAVAIGRALGCSEEDIDTLQFAGHLHDIGKIGIRDDILLSSGPLTTEEYDKIKQHPDIGANILGQLGLWEREKEIIRCHHERVDGTGYPRGLKGDEIPFLARILSLADVFDAISSGRNYRNKIPMQRCLDIIRSGAGTQFDPQVVDAFFALVEAGKLSRYMEAG